MKISRVEQVRRAAGGHELIMVAGIVMIVGTAQVVFYADALYKAMIMEPIGLMQPLKTELAERLALTGTWDDTAFNGATATPVGVIASRAGRGKRIASAQDLEDTNAVLAMTTALAAEVVGLAGRRESSSNAVVGLSNGIPMAVVSSSFVKTPSFIELRPVVNATAPAVVNWLCGNQRAFADTLAAPPREPAVPSDLLPLPCRVNL